MKYKLMIFDFDGTLADSFPWFVSVYDDLAKRYNIPRPDDDFEELRKLDTHQILKKYNIPLWKMMIIGRHLKKLMNTQIDKIKLVDGIQSVIDKLIQQGTRLTVVTSNAEKNVRQVLGKEYAAHFEYFECGASLFGKKNKFLKILKKTGVPAELSLCIGDEVRDLKAAKQARIPFGAVSWGYTHIDTLKNHTPEEIFTHPDQILQANSAIALL